MDVKSPLYRPAPQLRDSAEFAAQATTGAANILTDSSNVYFDPALKSLLDIKGIRSFPAVYNVDGPTTLYPVQAPVSDKGFLNSEGKLALDLADVLSSAPATAIWAAQAPAVAQMMPGVNIVVGVIGCYDKVSHEGLRRGIGQGLCFADLAAKVLFFLSQFVPGLQGYANYFLGVQVVVNVGDKVVQYYYRGTDPQGQTILQGLERSRLAAPGSLPAGAILSDGTMPLPASKPRLLSDVRFPPQA
jgi:hypothetical protein